MLSKAGAHPNILEIFEAVYDDRWCMAYMCMEYCSGGDLQELRCEYGIRGLHVPTALIFKAIIDISDGLAFLHGGWVRDEQTGLYYQISANPRSIIHRDLVRDLTEKLFDCCQNANFLYRKPRTSSSDHMVLGISQHLFWATLDKRSCPRKQKIG